MTDGIDVYSGSHGSPGSPADMQATKDAGATFVIVKLTQGTSYVNPWAVEDVAAALEVGLTPMVYHFPTFTDAATEWAFFRDHVPSAVAHLPLWLDLEPPPGVSVPWSKASAFGSQFLQTGTSAGFLMGLYCNVDWHNNVPGLADWGYPLWLADPSNVAPGIHRVLTQTGIGSYPGWPTPVDLDVISDPLLWAAMIGDDMADPQTIAALQDINKSMIFNNRLAMIEFVDYMYHTFVGRPPDPTGEPYYYDLLWNGTDPKDVLAMFCSTDEAKAYAKAHP